MNLLLILIALVAGYFMVSDKSLKSQMKKLQPIHYIGFLIVAVFVCNMNKREGLLEVGDRCEIDIDGNAIDEECNVGLICNEDNICDDSTIQPIQPIQPIQSIQPGIQPIINVQRTIVSIPETIKCTGNDDTVHDYSCPTGYSDKTYSNSIISPESDSDMDRKEACCDRVFCDSDDCVGDSRELKDNASSLPPDGVATSDEICCKDVLVETVVTNASDTAALNAEAEEYERRVIMISSLLFGITVWSAIIFTIHHYYIKYIKENKKAIEDNNIGFYIVWLLPIIVASIFVFIKW